MNKQTKGKCRFCGKEYTKTSMVKHISSCKERENQLDKSEDGKEIGYFGLVISGKYAKAYWLITEFREDATLKDLDKFLRDIWLECCGHLSSFEIEGISYESNPETMGGWGRPVKGMNSKLKNVLGKEGMVFDYEYDFGSTTALTISVFDYRIGPYKKEKLSILSRNNPIEYICDECGEKKATAVCSECMYDDAGLLCDDCQNEHECDEEMLMNICNSPRFGVCGYEGSSKYPD
jgi:hypothetical protein